MTSLAEGTRLTCYGRVLQVEEETLDAITIGMQDACHLSRVRILCHI